MIFTSSEYEEVKIEKEIEMEEIGAGEAGEEGGVSTIIPISIYSYTTKIMYDDRWRRFVAR